MTLLKRYAAAAVRLPMPVVGLGDDIGGVLQQPHEGVPTRRKLTENIVANVRNGAVAMGCGDAVESIPISIPLRAYALALDPHRGGPARAHGACRGSAVAFNSLPPARPHPPHSPPPSSSPSASSARHCTHCPNAAGRNPCGSTSSCTGGTAPGARGRGCLGAFAVRWAGGPGRTPRRSRGRMRECLCGVKRQRIA
jgi:hypothetical protein